MKVILAETAGFCYGVKRAVDIAENTAGERIYTLGSLIHNKHVTSALSEKGIKEAQSIDEIPPDATVIIRSHGAGHAELEALKERGNTVIDATCPNVAKIHRIVKDASDRGRVPVIIGTKDHPEVRAICGWANTGITGKEPVVFRDENDLRERMETELPDRSTPICVVHQTTGIKRQVKICDEILKKEYTNCEIFDTICDATSRRQKEAEELAEACDAMIIIGDRHSANAVRLAEICRKRCSRVIFTESASEIDLSELDGVKILGVTAGASTPAWIIKEVHEKMTDEVKEIEVNQETAVETEDYTSESFDEMLKKNFKTLNTGEKVSGIVQSISPTEVSVDLGTKHSGYIPISELTDDPDLKPEDIVQIGKEIEAYVMRVNDVEGTIMLSKKRLDTVKNWETVEKAREDRTILEGTIVEENKGGIVALVKGIRVFIPASQSGLPKNADMSQLLKTKQKLRITEVNRSKRRVVGSIREARYELRKASAEQTWNEIEVGKKYTGTVKSITSYGAFIDIGGVDGMAHVTELSWKRIKNPADILKIGDTLEVYVISFDKESKRISLGCKLPEDNPWNMFLSKYSEGSVLNVKIVKLMQFGAFAEILPGVDGLIHVSQITSERRIGKPDEVLSEGQEVTVKITGIDNEKQKVSLSIRALTEGPAATEDSETADEPDAVVYDTEAAPEQKQVAAEGFEA